MATVLDKIRSRLASTVRPFTKDGRATFPRLTGEQWNALELWLESRYSRRSLPTRDSDRERLIHDAHAEVVEEILRQRYLEAPREVEE